MQYQEKIYYLPIQSKKLQEQSTRKILNINMLRKVGTNIEYINLEERNAFLVRNIILSIIKCIQEYNHGRLKDILVNKKIV